MMQKDEQLLLEPWILYHGCMFGFENLFIYDNGSDDTVVRDVLNRYARVGVTVRWDRTSQQDFLDKGVIIGELVEALRISGRYDFFLPMDCDEFVGLSGRSGFITGPGEIHEYLDTCLGDERVRSVRHNLINIPGQINLFALIDFCKSIIPASPLRYLDHGFHQAQLQNDSEAAASRIVYFHLHNKPFDVVVRSARQKLAPLVDCDDLDGLRRYNSNGSHLIKYFFMDENEYVSSHDREVIVQTDALSDFFRTFRLHEFLWTWTRSGRTASRPTPAPTRIIQGIYHRADYLEANDDVARSDMDPLIHYCHFGEGRPTSPTRA